MTLLPLAALTCMVLASACHAGERSYSLTNGLFIHVDWQEPWFLPRRFRNHCSFDVTQARYYCSNHCGSDYEFIIARKSRSGCCHIGVGYCDWDGSAPKAAVARLIGTDGSQEVNLAKCWPQHIRKVELAVHALPKQEA